ncbi:MAG: sigma-54 dependent transcriptional regulator [Bacteroidales bacterium]|jgi:DNA-binding NtrC family response regulator|nr:sigma-54 dependent transcriptional regulator [Bacteroidales bacterium]
MKKHKGSILVVDDSRSILSTLEILLSSEFAVVTPLSNPNLILSELDRSRYDLVILDMNFSAGVNSGNEGLYWLERIKEKDPSLSVVMITAYGDIAVAVSALKAGASDFILKPWDNDKLLATARMAAELTESRRTVRQLKEREALLRSVIGREMPRIIGNSQKLKEVLALAAKVAPTDANVLITGGNGTGKELIARHIHGLSGRSDEVIVTVDMGAISETLFESELFGHLKGSFTDARENRQGKFEAARGGTLFLDEIGNLPVHLQSKLLSAIENRQVTKIGSNIPVETNIRLICATNRNLNEMVASGLFREDLLYRINTIHIEVPPLCERGDDIIMLAETFLRDFASRYGKQDLKLNLQAHEKLLRYNWPGNIRELRHTIEKAVILSESAVLGADDIVVGTRGGGKTTAEFRTIGEMEAYMITGALARNSGNLTAAAAELGITRQTLYNKMKRDKP